MLISHTHRFIYLKTAKTASSSTEVFFQSACMPPASLPEDWESWHKTDEIVSAYGVVSARYHGSNNIFRNHMSAPDVIDAIGVDIWSSYLTFANVRNPWDKVASQFFTIKPVDPAADYLTLAGKRYIQEIFAAFVDQYSRLDVEELLLHEAYRVDTHIRYEHLQADVANVARRCGFSVPNVPFPRLKTQSRPSLYRDYRTLYGPAERQRIADLYNDWIIEFGYAF